MKTRALLIGLLCAALAVPAGVVAQDKQMSIWDWAMIFVGPLFIAAALWRLARTACPPPGK